MKIVKYAAFLLLAVMLGGVVLLAVKGGTRVVLNPQVWATGVQTFAGRPGEFLRAATSGTRMAPVALGLMLSISGVFGIVVLGGVAFLAQVFRRLLRMVTGRRRSPSKGRKVREAPERKPEEERSVRDMDFDDLERGLGFGAQERIVYGLGLAFEITAGLLRRVRSFAGRLAEEIRARNRDGGGGQMNSEGPESAGVSTSLNQDAIEEFQDWYDLAMKKGGDQLAIARQAVSLSKKIGPIEKALIIEADANSGEFMLRMLDSWAQRVSQEEANRGRPSISDDGKMDVNEFRKKLGAAPRTSGTNGPDPRQVEGGSFSIEPGEDESFEDDISGGGEAEDLLADFQRAVRTEETHKADRSVMAAAASETARLAESEVVPGGYEGEIIDDEDITAVGAGGGEFEDLIEAVSSIRGIIEMAQLVAAGEDEWTEDLEDPEIRSVVFRTLYEKFEAFVQDVEAERIMEEVRARSENLNWAWLGKNMMPLLAGPEEYEERIIQKEETAAEDIFSGSGDILGGGARNGEEVGNDGSSAAPEDTEEGVGDTLRDPFSDFEEEGPVGASDEEPEDGPEETGDEEAGWSDDDIQAVTVSPESHSLADQEEGEGEDSGGDTPGEGEAVADDGGSLDAPDEIPEERGEPEDVGIPEEQEIPRSGDAIARWGYNARTAGAKEASVGKSLYVPGSDFVFRMEGILHAIMIWKRDNAEISARVNVIMRYIPEGVWRVEHDGDLKIVEEGGDFVRVSEGLMGHQEVLGQKNILHIYGPGAKTTRFPSGIAGFRIVDRVMTADEISEFVS